MSDITAITTANPNSGNAEGCYATGMSQPPLPPFGWNKLGSSPGVGQCYFSDLVRGQSYPYQFFSGECQYAGLNYQTNPWLTSDSNGQTTPQPVCTIPGYSLPQADSHVAASNNLPATVTISSTGLLSAYGKPQLIVYDFTGTEWSGPTANSVASDGSSATFPFPQNLPSNFYMFAIKNFTASNGAYSVPTATYYDIAAASTLANAFGVDAGLIIVVTIPCNPDPHPSCGSGTSVITPVPIFTQYYAGSVIYQGATIPVGSHPVAVKIYGTSQTQSGNMPYGNGTVTVAPTNAIVANSGSNNVSILSLSSNTVISTIAVGQQPMGVAVNGTSKAYVANYGSGTLSEVDLTNYVVSRTVSVGAGAQSVTVDPSGASVWVGGTNFISKVNLSNFTVSSTTALSGAVTSLASSAGQNELIYTLAKSCCGSGSNAAANEFSIGNLTSQGNYGSMPATPYANYTMQGTLPSAASLPSASAVSAEWANGMAASATPTGYVIYDLVAHKEIMRGTTPTPVRGIASDPSNTVVYLTLPDSNEYISVPLPH